MKSSQKKAVTLPQKKKNTSLYIVLVFGLSFLLYAQTIGFGLTNFDDDTIIENINLPQNADNIFTKALTTDALLNHTEPFYRPLQTLTYVFDLKISGENKTWMLHLTNVLIFCLIGCSLFILLLKFKIPNNLAFLATLVFCSHPLFVTSVAWIPARGDLLSTLSSLLSMLFFIEFIAQKKYSSLIFTWICFLLALFSKETTAFLPFIFMFYFFAFQSNFKIELKHILLASLILCTGIFWFWLRSISVCKEIDTTTMSNSYKDILSNFLIIPTAFSQIIWPFDFSTIPSFTMIKTLIGLVVSGFILYLIFKKTDNPFKEKLFFIFWFLLLIVPTFFIKQKFFDYLDHRFLLPMIGIFLLLLSSIASKWLSKGDIKSPWIFVILIALFSLISFAKSKSYTDTLSYCNAAINNTNKSVIALNNRGKIKQDSEDFSGAILDFNGAIEINNQYALPYLNRGGAKFMIKDYSGAVQDFNRDILLEKHPSKAFYFRGLSYASLGKFDKAIDDLNHFISVVGDDKFAYFHKGRILCVINKTDEALKSFTKAIKTDPHFFEAYSERALLNYRLRNLNGSINDCNAALLINPSDSIAIQIKEKAQEELHANRITQ